MCPNDASHTVYIGPRFEQTMSTPQLLTHELSHFNGTGAVVPFSNPPITGTVDNQIDPFTGRNSGESYGSGKTLSPAVALYHADTFGFYAVGAVPAKREVNYYQYLNQTNGSKR